MSVADDDGDDDKAVVNLQVSEKPRQSTKCLHTPHAHTNTLALDDIIEEEDDRKKTS